MLNSAFATGAINAAAIKTQKTSNAKNALFVFSPKRVPKVAMWLWFKYKTCVK
jgi:hypothetical protein